MPIDSTETEYTTLGDLLRQTRVKQGFDLEQVSDETKITLSNLRAMEDDNFNSLPAEAFARGFYTLYANALGLIPEEVLRIYTQEKSQFSGAKKKRSAPPPNKLAEQVSNLAEKSTVMPVSCSGLIALFLLIIIGFSCWYFSWNPANFLSEKLRSFQKTPEAEKVVENSEQTDKKAPLFKIVQVEKNESVEEQPDKKTIPDQ